MDKIYVQYLGVISYIPFLKLCHIDLLSSKIMSYEFFFIE